MNSNPYWLIAALMCVPGIGQTEVFKCLDASGKVTYSGKQEPGMTCNPVTATVNQVPAAVPAASGNRAEARPEADRTPSAREQLQKQIAAEEAALEKAKKDLAEQESIRLGDERNYQRVLDRLKPFQDKVAEIEKNLAALRAQLRNSK